MTFKIENPALRTPLAEYTFHSLTESLEKIRAFIPVQKHWSEIDIEKRASVLINIAAELRIQKQSFARQASLEMGKPITQSLAEVEKSARALEQIAELAPKNLKTLEVMAHYKKTLVKPEPFGLILSVQPWNFPYWQVFRMAACAWMTGNFVVLKHSNEVAGCAELIEKICTFEGKQILINLRLSHADTAEVIKSPLIKAVTFTGSTQAGKSIAQAAGGALKKCLMELGGSDAYIVMPDCDLDHAVNLCVQTRLINSGQSCISGKRFFIHDDIQIEFKKRMKEKMQTIKVGDPLDETTQVGPLASQRHLQILQEQVKRAHFAGAKLDWIKNEVPQVGSYTQLGILDFGSNLKVFENEEIFGPVASLYRFDKIKEVVEVLNQGPFGLGAGIFTKDLVLAEKISQEVQVGTFTINSFVQSDPRVPFGGVRDSGFGREMGREGLYDFVTWKVIGQD